MTMQRPMRSAGVLLAALLVLPFVFPSAGFAQAAAAKALDPIGGIVDAFKTHDAVALGEGDHGNEQGAAFRAKLYRDPRDASMAANNSASLIASSISMHDSPPRPKCSPCCKLTTRA
jgi:hypothetical protein